MCFCLLLGEKTEVVFRSPSDGTEILFIETVIMEKVKEEIAQIPVFTFKRSKRVV